MMSEATEGDGQGPTPPSRAQGQPAATKSVDGLARVLHLVDFLAAYYARKNPPVHDINTYGLYLLPEAKVPTSKDIVVTPSGERWLSVDFVELPPRPKIPEELVEAFPAKTSITPRSVPTPIVDATPAQLSAVEHWIRTVWTPWSERHRIASATKNLYRDLFETRTRLDSDRESVELVWGFGRLRWRPDHHLDIDHPMLTIPVEIEIDDSSQQLSVRPAGAVEIDSLYLAGAQLADRAGFNAARQTTAELDSPIDPWDSTVIEPLLRRLVRFVDQNGVVSAESEPGAATASNEWVLYLRRRQPDYQGFLERLRELYVSGATIPDPMQALVIDEPSLLGEGDQTSSIVGPDTSFSATRPVDSLLLPLPTNEEQQRILRLAQTRPGVTVQGPPGTGKSHTIANIISHYVAYGKRVLVVAEKEQALRVLAEKIPAGIRDLTVSVLGADEEGRRKLESSIIQIQTRVTGIDRDYTDREIARLTTELDAIDRRIAATTNELLDTRRSEVTTLDGTWQCGRNPTPSSAAAWVADNRTQFGYIPDRVEPTTPCPLTVAEFTDLIALASDVTFERARSSQLMLPDVSSLPSGSELAALFAEADTLTAQLSTVTDEITTWTAVDEHLPDLSEVRDAIRVLHDWLVKVSGTWLDRLRERTHDPLIASEWLAFVDAARSEREQIYTIRRHLVAHDVRTPVQGDPRFEGVLRDAQVRLADKGKLGMFAKEARTALEACSVDGRTPSSASDLELCLHHIRLSVLRRQIVTRWNNQVSRVDGPRLDDHNAEDEIGVLLDDINGVLAWPSRWAQLARHLRGILNSVPERPEHNDLARTNEILHMFGRRARQRELATELDVLARRMSAGTSTPESSPLWAEFTSALAHRRTQRWDELRAEAAGLVQVRPQGKRLLELHQTLNVVAPVWANRIGKDPAGGGQDPSQVAVAWEWRQVDTWVSTVSSTGDPAGLQHTLERLSGERRRTVVDLVSARAWRRLADNLKDRHRQALNSYVKAVSRYGKTGGKYAARWLSEIRSALNESKDAIPVWIMPTARALASFRADAQPPFDVLIIDEASQIGIDSIPLFSLARSTIVVGDDKQTSPENVGQDQQAVFDLMDEHLKMVPKYKTLFNPTNSLYDMAFQKFPDVVMLTEHFRCLPEIIQFSNIHAYDGRIIPLRDQPPQPGWSPLGAIKVIDGYRTGHANHPEADAVVDLIAELCEDPDYNGMDFGVVSLLGSEQSKLIWDKLFDRIGPDVLSERRIRCGEPANFQGDERDVMVLSTVVATDPANPTGRIGAMTGEAGVRRVNVAASRARNQMWVVHSVDADRFPKGDLRAELIRHCQNPARITANLADLEDNCDSDFERFLVRRIIARGYTQLKVQHVVGRYRIDMVIEGPDARLAIEADGDRWHGEDRWHQDRERQQVLERAGWTFERIRGSSFFRDPDQALEPLWKRLDALGIPTGDDWITATSRTAVRTVGAVYSPLVDADDDELPEAEVEWDAQSTTVVAAPDSAPIAAERPVAAWASPVRAQPLVEPPAAHVPVFDVHAPQPSASPIRPSPASIAPYKSWPSRPLAELSFATSQTIGQGLAEIVASEGPMHALFAYQLYVKAAGGQRVGKEIRRTFNQAANAAIQSGLIAQLKDSQVGQIDKTLYAPGTQGVIVRELGPRQLTDVPRSEIHTLMKQLGLSLPLGSAERRTILDALGLTRMTERVSTYLDECARYEWRI